MPYIPHNERGNVLAQPIGKFVAENAGQLNYAITSLLLNALPVAPRYADYNDMLGVLEAVKLEFYRRMVSVYEDQKMLEAGDVYPQ